MKYGKIINNHICLFIETDNYGAWQSGNIYYKTVDNIKTRKTATEIIAEQGLKEIVTPNDFSGNLSDYNFVETETQIIIADKKAEVATAETIAFYDNKIKTLKTEVSNLSHKFLNYENDLKFGEKPQYTAEQIKNQYSLYYLERNQINELREECKEKTGVLPNE